MITDEMVEKAEIAYDGSCQKHKGVDVGAMRAALEAVAPMLIAQWLRTEANKFDHGTAMIFFARAQELDPQHSDPVQAVPRP